MSGKAKWCGMAIRGVQGHGPPGKFENRTLHEAIWWYLWQKLVYLWVGNWALFTQHFTSLAWSLNTIDLLWLLIMTVKCPLLRLIKLHSPGVHVWHLCIASSVPSRSNRFILFWSWWPRSFNYSQTAPDQRTREAKTEVESVCMLGAPAAACSACI